LGNENNLKYGFGQVGCSLFIFLGKNKNTALQNLRSCHAELGSASFYSDPEINSG